MLHPTFYGCLPRPPDKHSKQSFNELAKLLEWRNEWRKEYMKEGIHEGRNEGHKRECRKEWMKNGMSEWMYERVNGWMSDWLDEWIMIDDDHDYDTMSFQSFASHTQPALKNSVLAVLPSVLTPLSCPSMRRTYWFQCDSWWLSITSVRVWLSD